RFMQQRRSAVVGTGRAVAAESTGVMESLRTDGDYGLVNGPPGHLGEGLDSDRAADCEHRNIYSGYLIVPCAGWDSGRAVHWREGNSARLFKPIRVDRREIHPRSFWE